MTEQKTSQSAALKAAKKLLKKSADGSLALKELAKAVVAATTDNDQVTRSNVKTWIQESQKFQVDDDKRVSLKKKRKSGEDSNKKKSKRPKTSSSLTPSSSSSSADPSTPSDDVDSMAKWRQEHKVVIKHYTEEDEAGLAETKKLNESVHAFPYCTFASAESTLAQPLIQHCVKKQFTKPSPIQAQAWPLLTGSSTHTAPRDVVGIAETGSGKTLAFALPALTAIWKQQQEQGNHGNKRRLPRMLVLSPTRELALQSGQVLEEFGATVGLNTLVIYGGVPKYTQVSALKKGSVDCLVATPGRLVDLMQEGSCQLNQIEWLVLDEADRMLDLGFAEEVNKIVSACPVAKKRRTAMFSATWPASVANMAADYLNNPVRVYVGFDSIVSTDGGSGGTGVLDDSLSANKRVEQSVQVVNDHDRPARLRQVLKQHASADRILIFALYKKEAEHLERSLAREGYRVGSIHGNKAQPARTAALDAFKKGTTPLLVATDVAARGLDIPNVAVVVNYTFPLTIEDYVHRIGRTGRAGKKGLSITFFQPSDKAQAGSLQQVMKQAGQEVPEELAKFGSTVKRKEHKLYGSFGPTGGLPMKKATKITFGSDDES